MKSIVKRQEMSRHGLNDEVKVNVYVLDLRHQFETMGKVIVSFSIKDHYHSYHHFLIQNQSIVCYCVPCLSLLIHRSIFKTSIAIHSPIEAYQLIGYQTCLKQASQLLPIANEMILRRIVTNLIHCTPLPELGDTVMITVNDMGRYSSYSSY